MRPAAQAPGVRWTGSLVWTITTAAGWAIIMIPASFASGQMPATLGDFSTKAIPEAVAGLVLTGIPALAGVLLLAFAQGTIVHASCGCPMRAWVKDSAAGLLLGWCAGWGVTGYGLLLAAGQGVPGVLVASGLVLGVAAGLGVSLAQAGSIAEWTGWGGRWLAAGLVAWLAAGILYMGLFHLAGGVIAGPIADADPTFGRSGASAGDDDSLLRGVVVGWLGAALLVGAITAATVQRISSDLPRKP